ncbi:hypothetical protein NPX13_g8616 [Xylaria arbuscula]|uniref:Heterokaryon incompatibility domain-containing protein n=1 Tax=Xylaria arbuscula TaxID=114810 RepID=A0A9W8TI73_9PEZI|nr:hypothetical protein NPX13_g8616 [Xylaria arbuscula]
MPRYDDAARVAAQIGIDLKRADWRGYKPQERGLLNQYNALLAAESGRRVLRDLDERPLSYKQSQRAWKALRLDARTHKQGEKSQASSDTSKNLNTRIRLRYINSRSSWNKNLDLEFDIEMCIFINGVISSAELVSSEEWSLQRYVTVGFVYTHTNLEVIVSIGETVLATILYEQAHQKLLQVTGQLGVALEILSALNWARLLGFSNDNFSLDQAMQEFEDVEHVLMMTIGAAAALEFKDTFDTHGSAKVKPQCSSRWMPGDFALKLLAMLPVREGFVDLRDGGGYAVRNEAGTSPASSFPLPSVLEDCTDTVGGPASLWVDTLCIDQKTSYEKAMELTHMRDYYAAAHTTLIVPERAITSVPSVQPSRYLVAMPDQLRNYQGLKTWRQDKWHTRVWAYQEGLLSRNPRIVNSDTNTGLSACWLDFIALAAEQNRPTLCEVGLPPWYLTTGREYGGYDDYKTPFLREWAACTQHSWAPDPAIIQVPLGALLDFTTQRRCTEEQDSIIGLLGLAISAEDFHAEGIRDLDNAYREAVRCGAIGAEVLRADLGGTSPNSCWIPKKADKASFAPSMRNSCNALQPTVDQGRLVCKAFEVIIDPNDRARCTNRGTHSFFMWSLYGKWAPRRLSCYGNLSPHGNVYVLEAAEDDSPKDRILLCASVTDSGSHHVESTAIISRNHVNVNNGTLMDLLRGKGAEHVTLSLGSSFISAFLGGAEPMR